MSRREFPLADRLAALREAVEVAEGRLDVPEVGAGPRPAGQGRRPGGARRRHRGRARRCHRQREVHPLQRAVRRRGQHARACGGPRPASRTPPCGGRTGADRLLDWLEVPRRHRHEPEPALDGLVLLDLPDHDSVKLEHRLEVDRLVGLVDVLVWVLDPEKYADAAVHDRYLAPLAGHAGVLLVVLNQIDRLDVPPPRRSAWPTCGRCWTGRGWPRRRCSRCRPAPARAWPSCAASSPTGWRPGGRPPTGSPPTSGAAAAGLAAHCPEDDAAALGRRERTEPGRGPRARARRRRRGARGDGGRRAVGAARTASPAPAGRWSAGRGSCGRIRWSGCTWATSGPAPRCPRPVPVELAGVDHSGPAGA